MSYAHRFAVTSRVTQGVFPVTTHFLGSGQGVLGVGEADCPGGENSPSHRSDLLQYAPPADFLLGSEDDDFYFHTATAAGWHGLCDLFLP